MTRTPRRHRAVGILTALLLAVSAGLWMAAPAQAATSIEVSKTTGVNPKGDKLHVTGAGFKTDIQVFVAFCDPSKPAGGACDMGNFGMVDIKPDGTFETDLKVVAEFGNTDCMKVGCAVMTSRVGQGADRTQEAYAPVMFKGQTVEAQVPDAPVASPSGPTSETPSATATDPTTPDATGTPGEVVNPEATASDVAATSADSGSGVSPVVWIVIAVAVVLAIGGGAAAARKRGSRS